MDEKTLIKMINSQEKASTALVEVTKNQTELLNTMIAEIEEKANIAKSLKRLVYVMIGFLLVVLAMVFLPATFNNKVEIREIDTGRLFEVVK
jgi:hypothetical protein